MRDQVSLKAVEMRRQGFFGPAMWDISELEYGGTAARLQRLETEFVVTAHEPIAHSVPATTTA